MFKTRASRQSKILCSVPNCANHVSYHTVKANKTNDGISVKWKAVCEKHRRGIGKDLVDRWKMNEGCANVGGKYGFTCTSRIHDPAQLQINHIDGNNLNRDEDNIEILCGNCHAVVTQQNRHYLPKNHTKPDSIFKKLFKGL